MSATTETTGHACISSSRVEGTAVYNARGDKLGTIDDLVIDKVSGHVRYATLEFGGFLGMGTDRYPVPWNLLTYDTARDGYVVPLDKAQLDRAPKFGEGDDPAFDDAYGRRVHEHYGVAWD